jgi:glycosyltransferase involved in cell wall biosynthesis
MSIRRKGQQAIGQCTCNPSYGAEYGLKLHPFAGAWNAASACSDACRHPKLALSTRFMKPKNVSNSIEAGSGLVGPRDEKSRAAAAAPRLLYVVSEDWYFLSHRLPMARAARDAGFEVHVAGRIADGSAAIEAEQFILHPVPFARGRLSPLAAFETILALRRVLRAVGPSVIHHVSLQPTVLGLFAALGHPVACVNALNGLGYSFTTNTTKAEAVKHVISTALRFLLDREGMISLVQNRDDLAVLTSLGIPITRIALIHGSGVDVKRLLPLAEPQGVPTVAFVGRLLDNKGIRTLIAAHRLLRARGTDVRLLIAGTPDPANPTSVTGEEAASWNNEDGITWFGHVADISALWARAHIAVLPSRGGEGLPLSLLEAAACGRPMIATDVPGCREIVIPGETGLLVPVDDAAALACAIGRLAGAQQLRAQFAATGRRLAVSRFSAEIVAQQTVDLYRRLLNCGTPLQMSAEQGGNDEVHGGH